MYGIPIAVQTRVMLLALGLGFIIGIIYDIFRIIRLSISRGRTAVFVQDILFFFLFAGLSFAFCLSQNNGQVRFYIIFAEVLGFLIYYFSLGSLVIRLSDKIIAAIKKLLEQILRLISLPINLIFRIFKRIFSFFVRITKKNSKKYGKKMNFLLQRNRSMLYNVFGKVFIQKKENQKGTQSMAKAKRKNRSIILIMAVLVVGVSFFSIFLKLQFNIKEREKEALAVQEELEQVAAENERLRDYLNSDDEAKIIEEYARNYRDFVYPDENVYYDVTPGNN